MSVELDNLKAALATLATDVQTNADESAAAIAEIKTLVTQIGQPGISPADVQAAANNIKTLATTLEASNQAVKDAVSAAANPQPPAPGS